MYLLLTHLSVPHLLQHRLRTYLTLLAVAFGVAAVVVMHAMSVSVVDATRYAVAQVAGRAQLSIGNGAVGVAEELLETVRAVPGVETAVPVLEIGASAVDLGEQLQVFGIDLLDDQAVRTYDLARESASIEDPIELLARPAALLMSDGFAARHVLVVGDEVTLLTPAGSRAFHVAGLLQSTGPAAAYGGNLVVMDIFTAQKFFGEPGRFERIDAVVGPDADVPTVQAAIAAVLGGRASVGPTERRQAGLQAEVDKIAFVARATSLMGLTVALFLIYNTISISVAQRRREFATLRAIGITRGGLRRYLLAETVMLAVPACLLGMGLGAIGARLAIPAFATFISQHIVNLGVVGSHITPLVIVAAVGLGLIAAIIGTLAPARSAAAVSVVEGLRPEREVRRPGSELRLLACGGLGLLAAAALIVLQRDSSQSVPLLVFPLLGIGGALCLPEVFRQMGAGAGTWLRACAPALGQIVAANVATMPRRSAATAATVMFAAAAVLAVEIILASINASTEQWGDRFFPADVMVTSGSPMFEIRTNLMPPDVVGDVKAVPGVADVCAMRIADEVPSLGGMIRLVAQDFAIWARHGGSQVLYEGTAEGTLAALLAGEVLVSDNFTRRTGRGVGDTVELSTSGGLHTFRIAGVFAAGFLGYYDGTVQMDLATYRRYWRDDHVTTLNVFVAPGATAREVQESVRRRHGAAYALFVLTRAEQRQAGLERLAQAFRLTQGIEALVALLAAFSVLNTLLASVIDRAQEIGTLRLAGATMRQVSRAVLLECGLLTAVGLVTGIGLGLVAAGSLVSAFDYFGWYVPYTVPIGTTTTRIAAMVAALGLAAGYPARLAAALPTTQCLRTG